MSEQLLIAGFHRSGTSLTASLLHRAGLFLGKTLLGANPSNPFGHYEDVEVFRIHERILHDHRLDWHIDFPFIPMITDSNWNAMEELIERRKLQYHLWGFKDPRLCHFLMCWKYLLPGARVLIVYRHFLECCASLARRHSNDLLNEAGPRGSHLKFWTEPDHALRMWLYHNKCLLFFANRYPADALVVSTDMLYRGFPLVRAINQRWDSGLQDLSINEVYQPNLLYKRKGKQVITDKRLQMKVLRVWDGLEKLAKDTYRQFVGSDNARY